MRGPPLIRTANLIGYYPLAGHANDMSGNARHGTVMGAPAIQAGRIDASYYFARSTSKYIDLNAHVAAFEGHNAGTIAFWCKSPGALTAVQYAFSISDKDSGTDFMYVSLGDATGAWADESVAFQLTRVTTPLLFSARNGHGAYLDGNWHHIVCIIGDGNNRFVVDGVPQTSAFFLGAATTNEFSNLLLADTVSIGQFNALGSTGADLSICQLGFWNAALTDAEAKALFAIGVHHEHYN